MTKKLILLILPVFMLTFGSSAQAALTGNISGTIVDSTGQPLPGVMVSVSGTGFPGDRTDYTRDNGVFRVVMLPPGKYVVKAELSGFKTIEKNNVEVTINQTTTVDLALEVSTFEEVVIVTAEAPVLDTKSTSVGLNVKREFSERLPGSDQFQDVFAMSGATTGSSNPHVAGGTTYDNLYLYDGVDTTDPVTHTFSSNLNADAVEEVEVQTGGFTAEYGKAMGGIVNVVTKSGANDFEGIVRFKYETDEFTAPVKDDHPETIRSDQFEPTLSFGGPIVKDKAWFFLSYRRTEVSDSFDTRYTRDPVDLEYTYSSLDSDQLWQYYVAKLTWSLTASQNFELNFSSDPAVIDNASDTQHRPEAQERWKQGGDRIGLNWTYIHSSNLFFDTRFGYFNSYIYQHPMNDSGEPAVEDRRAGIWYNNFEQDDDNDRSKWSISTAATLVKDNWKGTHEFKTGFEYQNLEERRDVDWTTGRYYRIDWYGTDQEQPFERINNVNPSVEKNKGKVISYFLQDTWSIFPGFSFNPGLRFDWASYINKEDTTVHTFDNMIAPRIGFAWDLKNDGKSKLYANYGRYYNTYDLTIVGANPGASARSETWRYDPTNSGADDEGYYLFSWSGGDVTRDKIDPDLKPEYADEYMVGYDQEVFNRFSAGARFIYRMTRDIIEDVGFYEDESGNIHLATDVDINNQAAVDEWYENWAEQRYYYTNPDDAFRDYLALELHTTARTDKLLLEFSYTYSEATGTGENEQPSSSNLSHFSVYYDTPVLSHNIDGPLSYDVPHYLKLYASYQLPWDFSIGTHMWYKSGYTYNLYGDHGAGPDGIFGTDDDVDNTDPSYGSQVTLPEGRGAYRLPDVFMVDLSIQKDFNLGKWGILTGIIDITNVLDNQVNTERNELEGADHGLETNWAGPRSVLFQMKYAF
ncbi:TonB-dependent receptor [bacterium]|nr:TonB-dependent receptor [bacterium]